MARAFAKISFTSNVRAVQSEMGSRVAYQAAEQGEPEDVALGAWEQEFIAQRDSFYQATVSESGWPYLQHRGGPVGFLKILDDRTIGYADYSGNRQYLSVGNLRGNDRVSLFLMDYPQRQRLKIWGRARVVDELKEPELLAKLESADFRARIERGIVIKVEAYDWNCPKYITPRYSQDEVDQLLMQTRSQAVAGSPPSTDTLGHGVLPLTVSAIRQLTPRIRSYELRHKAGESLPPFSAGAHINIPIQRADGSITNRSYSLTEIPANANYYSIAVLRVNDGASQALQDNWQIGTCINIDEPKNYFTLHTDKRPAVLIAGGIGITPIKAMAETLRHRNADFQLHYCGRSPSELAFREELQLHYQQHCRFYYSQEPNHTQLNIEKLLRDAPADTVFYVCGPTRLIDAVRQTARELQFADERVQYESFV